MQQRNDGVEHFAAEAEVVTSRTMCRRETTLRAFVLLLTIASLVSPGAKHPGRYLPSALPPPSPPLAHSAWGSADTLADIHKMKPKANKNSSGTIALLPSLARHTMCTMEGERTVLHLMQD